MPVLGEVAFVLWELRSGNETASCGLQRSELSL
jgi:hypothetical protein